MSFWPKSSPKGARRKKLVAPPDDPPATAPPAPDAATPAKAPLGPRKRVKLSAKPLVTPKPKKAWSMVVSTGSLVGVLMLFGILFAWGAGMTLLLIFGDKMSARLIAQNSEMQDAYEQRLQAYRDEIARVISESEQNRVDRDLVTGRVIELTRRQRAIENRLIILNKIADQVGVEAAPATPSVGAAPPATTPGAAPPAPPPRPGFPARPTTPGQTRGDAPLPAFPWSAEPVTADARDGDWPPLGGLIHRAQFIEPPTVETGPSQSEIELEAQISRLESAVLRLDASQARALTGMVRLSEVRLTRFRNALSILGLSPEELAPDTGRTPTNMPALVVPIAEQNTPFGQRINLIRGNVSLLYRLQPVIGSMPLARPTNEARFSSPFGFRIHPISGVKKLHAGLDLAGPIGTPVRAAGAGVVLTAGWGGGYGNLVQIDHGHGVITRYAHLSTIEVAQGQPVALGAQVGLMGSTGASTGSHLHFETRVRSAPANPACFLIAGDRLRDALSSGFVCEKAPFSKDAASSEDEDDDS